MNTIRRNVFNALFFLTSARYRKIKNSGIFDQDYYYETHPDVASQGEDPLVHYIRGGWREERSPGPLFDLAIISASFQRTRRSMSNR